jgi:hypothetical protein
VSSTEIKPQQARLRAEGEQGKETRERGVEELMFAFQDNQKKMRGFPKR